MHRHRAQGSQSLAGCQLRSLLKTLLTGACLTLSIRSVSGAYIDPNLKPSTPTVTPITYVDTSLKSYDKLVLKVDNNPFFFNGIQLRADKLRDVYGQSESQIKTFYQQVADDGFTSVNTQVFWSNVQPDRFYNAAESTYIRGGRYANNNYASSTSNMIGYGRGVEGSKMLTYVKFDFSDYKDGVDGAKVRFYFDSDVANGVSFSATLYGITNNTWSASSITWTHAPNHDGVDIAGSLGKDYFIASGSPKWDPISSKAFYDFDATDFIKNHSPNRVASFILQASTNVTSGAIGATVSGAKGSKPPQLVLSDQDRFDWKYVDALLGWAEAAGVKFEFVWFGSDSTGVTMDSRVPHFAMLNTKIEKANSDGSHSPVFQKNSDPAYGVYWYFLDKNDLTTRAQEKRAIKELMNHVADYNKAHGNKNTVIGVDVANEPAIQKFHGSGFTAWHNPKTWAALGNFTSVQDFVDRTMWEYCVNLANAVKESNYVVWTRSNDVRGVDAAHSSYNEAQRKTVGTSVDFIGIDPYSNDISTAFKFGHGTSYDGKTFAVGKNLPMIMENGGSYDNTPALILATLAGGGLYNVYDYMSSDNLGMYVPTDSGVGNYSPKARGSYVQTVRSTNKMLKKVSTDLASRSPKASGGTALDFLNVFQNTTTGSTSFGSVNVSFQSESESAIVIVVRRSDTELAILSTGSVTNTIASVTGAKISSVESGQYDGSQWVRDKSVQYSGGGSSITFSMNAYDCIRVVTK